MLPSKITGKTPFCPRPSHAADQTNFCLKHPMPVIDSTSMRSPSRMVRIICLVAPLLFVVAPANPAHADSSIQFNVDKPAEGTYIQDQAQIIDPSAEQQINAISSRATQQYGVPIFVVTVDRLLAHGNTLDVEMAAHSLYDSWGIGAAEHDGKPWNKGVLILISQGDRTARIQLGSGYAHDKDIQVSEIMSSMKYSFANGSFSAGAVAASNELLADVVIGKPQSKAKSAAQLWPLALVGVLFLFLLGLVISLFRQGRKGWGWAGIGLLTGIVGLLAYSAFNINNDDNDFSSDSTDFGGGSADSGGGATGSW